MKRNARRPDVSGLGYVIFVSALALIFCYALFQAISPARDKVQTAELVVATDRDVVAGTACIIREETVIPMPTEGMLYPLCADGEKVSADAPLFCLYPSVPRERWETVLTQLTAADETLSLLTRSEGETHLSLLPSLRREIDETYLEVLDELRENGGCVSPTLQNRWQISANRLKTMTGGTDYRVRVQQVRDERETLLASCGTGITVNSAAWGSGYYWSPSFVDGYEASLSVADLPSMTPETLQQTLDNCRAAPSGNVGGKLIRGGTWYLAMPVSPAAAAGFSVGNDYTVSFAEDGLSLAMTLQYLNADAGENASVLLVFSCDRMPSGFSYERLQRVSVVTCKRTGYRLPDDTLLRVNGVDGVFILRGGMVCFRRVSVIGSGRGYVMAAQIDPVTDSDLPYLAPADMLITRGKRLYDGKVLS